MQNTEQRRDGRQNNQMRPISTEQGTLNRADGSARYTTNKTSILSAVYGPTEVKQRDEILDRATIKVIWKPKTGVPGCAEKEKELIIRRTFENVIISTLHPRTLITIIVQVMNDDGNLLATAINSVCLALMDAGIPLNSTLLSVGCIFTKENVLMLDPISSEEKEAEATFTFAFHGRAEGMILSHTTGSFEESDYFRALSACKTGVLTIQAFLRKSSILQYTHQ